MNGYKTRSTTRIVVVGLTLALATFAAPPGNDWLIVPGKRIGPIDSGTSHADLIRIFGAQNVEDKPVDTGNGPEPVTIVLGHDPSTALTLLFQQNRISQVFVCRLGHTCKWHTSDGLHIGSSMDDLEKLNGGPFTAYPWNSDLGGTIFSWNKGKLADELGEGGTLKLVLRLGFPALASGAPSEQRQAMEQIEKRKQARSDDPAVRKLQPSVDSMSLRFPAEPGR